jgi:hypothetical protein
MDSAKDNPVRRAVELVGGPSKAARACRVTPAAIYRWYDEGHVARTKYAVRLARAAGIDVSEIADLDADERPDGTPQQEAAPATNEAHGTTDEPDEDEEQQPTAASYRWGLRRRAYAAPAARRPIQGKECGPVDEPSKVARWQAQSMPDLTAA